MYSGIKELGTKEEKTKLNKTKNILSCWSQTDLERSKLPSPLTSSLLRDVFNVNHRWQKLVCHCKDSSQKREHWSYLPYFLSWGSSLVHKLCASPEVTCFATKTERFPVSWFILNCIYYYHYFSTLKAPLDRRWTNEPNSDTQRTAVQLLHPTFSTASVHWERFSGTTHFALLKEAEGHCTA